jgi:hypothetical protein
MALCPTPPPPPPVHPPPPQTDSDHLVPLLTLTGKVSWEVGGDSDGLVWLEAMVRFVPQRCASNDNVVICSATSNFIVGAVAAPLATKPRRRHRGGPLGGALDQQRRREGQGGLKGPSPLPPRPAVTLPLYVRASTSITSRFLVRRVQSSFCALCCSRALTSTGTSLD